MTVDLKGLCFHGGDVPNTDYPHFIVIASDNNPEGKVLVVPFSSIKFNSTADYQYKGIPCKYYDDACVLDGNEIIDDNGKPVLNRPSFVRYEWALEIETSAVFTKKLHGIYRYKCRVPQDVLKRVQDGAKCSKEIKPYFSKYFSYF